ncbi:FKBP-type peptidyl-prolyl cis-trans isomerase (plasmid) [Acinetobacter baumannii]|nr:FKBP-type peptidyl-prolyl cis-trans isomerase [Acinetobacter baumannii]
MDNTRSREEPVSLTIGDGNLLPGFEKALLGLRAGDRRTSTSTTRRCFWSVES